MANSIKIGALVSGGGTNLQAIIDACEQNRINGRMVFVGSDNPSAKGLERARKHGIATFSVDYRAIIKPFKNAHATPPTPTDFNLDRIRNKQTLIQTAATPQRIDRFLCSRAVAEDRLIRHMKAHDFDLLVLAGFMRTLTPYFIDRISPDAESPTIMNIHPALLPAFPGTDGYGDTFRYGCKVGGCTVHFIDYGEDSGPIIGQKSFAIAPDDTLDDVRKKGLALEWQLYPECIALFAQRRLKTRHETLRLPDGKKVQRTVTRILPAEPEPKPAEVNRRSP